VTDASEINTFRLVDCRRTSRREAWSDRQPFRRCHACYECPQRNHVLSRFVRAASADIKAQSSRGIRLFQKDKYPLRGTHLPEI